MEPQKDAAGAPVHSIVLLPASEVARLLNAVWEVLDGTEDYAEGVKWSSIAASDRNELEAAWESVVSSVTDSATANGSEAVLREMGMPETAIRETAKRLACRN